MKYNSKTDLNRLIRAWCILRISQKSTMHQEQKAHDKFSALMNKLSAKYPDLDWSSQRFWDELNNRAKQYETTRPVTGPGIDF